MNGIDIKAHHHIWAPATEAAELPGKSGKEKKIFKKHKKSAKISFCTSFGGKVQAVSAHYLKNGIGDACSTANIFNSCNGHFL